MHALKTRLSIGSKLAFRRRVPGSLLAHCTHTRKLPKSGSSPVRLLEFLYYRNVPNEFAAIPLLFRRGHGDEFFEARIIPGRVEHWIEPKQRRRKRQVRSQWIRVRYRDFMRRLREMQNAAS